MAPSISKKMISILLLISVLSFAGGCRNKPQRYEASFLQLFDTVTTIVAISDNKSDFTEMAQFIHDDLYEYHKLYDIYNNYDGVNNIKTINDNAGKSPIKVDRKIIDLLLFAKAIYKETGGMCNIAMGSVLKIWHNYRETGINDPENALLPPMEDLQKAALHTDIEMVVIDENNSTVYLSDSQMSLDVGAVAKGYAVERVCRDAIARGYDSLLVSVGGNVRAVGYKEGDTLWKVAVQNPDTESDNKELLTTSVHDKAVVTSGIYERYYTVDRIMYHHIIDPKTLMPSTYYKSLTIICDDSGEADGLSTALFNMPYEDGLKYIINHSGIEAMWVMPDGKINESPGFKDYLK